MHIRGYSEGQRGVAKLFRIALLLVLFAVLLSCARQRRITRDELSSDLISAISVASATEMSIDFVSRGQATRNFAVGHFTYLSNQLKDAAKELDSSIPEAGLERKLRSSRAQMDALSSELNAVVHEIGRPEALSASKKRVDAIRKSLEEENASR
jgi:hypothetical protein